MFRNYLKIAWRHMVKRRFYALVNIVGLALGMTFTLLIGSYVWGELRVNGTLRNADNQYIIRSHWKKPGLGYEDVTAAPLGKLLKEQYPSLVANCYRFDAVMTSVSTADKRFPQEATQAGDSTMLTMFGFDMLYGDARTALKDPNSVVITEDNARKYFGRTDVLGRVLNISNFVGGRQAFVVKGVLKNPPRNSVTYLWDLPTTVFIPFNSLKGRMDGDNWQTWNIANYLELQDGVQPSALDGPIRKLIATYAPKPVQENLQPYLTPLRKYYRDFNHGIVQKTIYTLSGVALFLLLMAIVNFVNISVANAASRIREIGVRKTLGSLRRQLTYQFLTESVLLAVLAMGLSLLFYELLRSSFSDIVERPIASWWTISPYFLGVSVLFALLTGILAGSYPAFMLAALPTVASLKGKLKTVGEGVLFRRLLLTGQFTTALLIFCGAIVVSQQIAYFFRADLGYQKDSILLVWLPRDWTPQGVAHIETVRNELARLTDVADISTSSSSLKGGPNYDINLYPTGTDSTNATATYVLQTDEHFVSTYQIPMVAGSFFRSSAQADQENRIVLNETAVRTLGYKTPASAIGRQVYSQGYNKPITIIGVTKDFSFRSMREKIPPTAISHINGAGNLFSYFSIKLASGNLPEAITSIEKRFHQLLPDAPFEVSLADDALQQLYQSELQLKKAAQTATALATLIVLAGILGMVSLSVVRRTKELAIRKVLGANTLAIIRLFLSEFALALLVAVALAFPLASWLMNHWLQGFAYHITLDWLSFLGVGLAFFVAIGLVVSLQTLQAALVNPVKSLRSE